MWSLNNIVFKIAFMEVSAPIFNLLRLVIAFPFMIYLSFFLPHHVPFQKKDLLSLTFIGIIGFGLFQLFFPVGIDQTSPAIGGILMATMPILVILLSLIFKLEKITLPIILGIFFTVIGLTLIAIFSTQQNQQYSSSLRGILFVVIAELGFALNTTLIKPYTQRYHPLQLTGYVMSISVLVFCAVHLNDLLALEIGAISMNVYLLASYSGLIALLGANVLWNKAVGEIGSARTSVYANVPPVFVLILSIIFFKDIPHPISLLGSIIILGGVITVYKREKKAAIQLSLL